MNSSTIVQSAAGPQRNPRRAIVPLATLHSLIVLLATLMVATPAHAQSRGVSKDQIVLGMTGAFSGSFKENGRLMKAGLDAAIMATNEKGGIHGRKLILVAADHANDPTRSMQVLKDLVENQGVFAFIGNTGSAALEIQLPYFLSKGILLFGPLPGAMSLRNEPPDRYVFNCRASYAEEVAAATQYLIEVRGLKPSQIAFFGQEDAFGDSGWKGFSKTMRRFRHDPLKTVRVGYKRNTDSIDVEPAVKTIRKHASSLRAVVMAASYRPAANFISKTCDLGLKYSNTSAGQTNELSDLLVQSSPQCAEGVMVTQAVPLPSSGSSLVMRYRQDMGRYRPAERPDFLSLQSYITAQIFIEGLRRAGPNLDTEKLIDALEGIHNWDIGLGVPISFSLSEHQASHRVWMATLTRTGVIKPLDSDLP